MKIRTYAILALMTVASVSAFADFIAGRVRPGFRADMKTVQASGRYKGIEGAQVTLNFEDGKADAVSISVSLPNTKKTTTFPIRSVKKSSCGDHYEAYLLTQSRIQTSFNLVDYSNAMCERVINNIWELSVQNSDGVRVTDFLNLAGNPEPVYVTL